MKNNVLPRCPICKKSFKPSTKEELKEDEDLLGEELADLGDLGRPTCKCDMWNVFKAFDRFEDKGESLENKES